MGKVTSLEKIHPFSRSISQTLTVFVLSSLTITLKSHLMIAFSAFIKTVPPWLLLSRVVNTTSWGMRLAIGVYNIANGNRLMIEATMGDYEVSSSVFKMNEEFYTTSVTVYVEGELKIVVSGLEAKFNEGT